MADPTKKIKNTYPLWVHSWHKKDKENGVNVVGVKEQVIIEYEDGTTEQVCGINTFVDPKRPFYITKPEHRNHTLKLEFELMEKCDKYMVRDSELEDKLQEALYGRSYGGYPKRLNQLCANPYVYGADIDTQTLIRQKYINSMNPKYIPEMTTGTLDIENDPDTHEINLITYSHQNIFFTGALRSYVKERMPDGNYEVRIERDLRERIKKYPQAQALIDKYGVKIHVKIFDTEIELIQAIFEKIHHYKTDFVGIWNIAHDIPVIMERIEYHGRETKDIMCPKSLPDEYKFVDFKYDKRPDLDHFTDRWHWCTVAGYTQFVDKQNLYARLRKASGRDVKYSLDYISDKELGYEKLHIIEESHTVLQRDYFIDYYVYNLQDCMLLHGLNVKNNDMCTLHGVTGLSHISRFNSMGVLIRDYMHDYGKRHNLVVGTSTGNMFTEIDKLMEKAGGTVLPPNKAIGVTVPIIDICSRDTQVCIYSNDIDVSSQYPSVIITCNISKATCMASAIKINGYSTYEMEWFFSSIIDTNENAVAIAEKFFSMPNYTEFDKIYEQLR